MITYHYVCKQCSADFELLESIKDEPLKECPLCHSDQICRIIHAPLYVKVVGEPTTLGQLAERNSKGMSQEQKDKLQKQYKTQKTINRIPDNLAPKRATPTVDNSPTPEWVEKPRTKTHAELNKMSQQQLEKYVYTGE